MSGQWQPVRYSEEMENVGNLRCLINRLFPSEVTIVTAYVELLLKSRPEREGWVTTVDGPGWVEKEDRAHMAVSELENDPR